MRALLFENEIYLQTLLITVTHITNDHGTSLSYNINVKGF